MSQDKAPCISMDTPVCFPVQHKMLEGGLQERQSLDADAHDGDSGNPDQQHVDGRGSEDQAPNDGMHISYLAPLPLFSPLHPQSNACDLGLHETEVFQKNFGLPLISR